MPSIRLYCRQQGLICTERPMHIYINTAGCVLTIRDNHLVVKPPEGEVQRIPLQQVRSLHLSPKIMLSGEVLHRAVANDIDVQFVGRSGAPFARLWSNRFGSISTIRKNQLEFSAHPAAMRWVKALLLEKVENQTALLFSIGGLAGQALLAPGAEKLQEICQKIERFLLKDGADTNASGLRALEAAASKIYFQHLNLVLPPQFQFARRSQRPAEDMFNSMLNYCYGILYGKIEAALIKAGIDPHIGIFHRDDYNKPVLTFDFIEKFRCWADFVVVRLCQQEVMFIEFFDVNGLAFLLNGYGKRIVIQAFEDYLDEVVDYEKLQRSRSTHIDLSAQRFAAYLKNQNYHKNT